jgi:hypothetical protein
MFENKAVRSTFGPKREEVIRQWRKLHEIVIYKRL